MARITSFSSALDGCALVGSSLTIVACLLLHFWSASTFGASSPELWSNLIGLAGQFWSNLRLNECILVVVLRLQLNYSMVIVISNLAKSND